MELNSTLNQTYLALMEADRSSLQYVGKWMFNPKLWTFYFLELNYAVKCMSKIISNNGNMINFQFISGFHRILSVTLRLPGNQTVVLENYTGISVQLKSSNGKLFFALFWHLRSSAVHRLNQYRLLNQACTLQSGVTKCCSVYS